MPDRAASGDPSPPPLVGLTREGEGCDTLSFLLALLEGLPALWQGLQMGSPSPITCSLAQKHPRNRFEHPLTERIISGRGGGSAVAARNTSRSHKGSSVGALWDQRQIRQRKGWVEREQCWQKVIPSATEIQIPHSPDLRGSEEPRGLSSESCEVWEGGGVWPQCFHSHECKTLKLHRTKTKLRSLRERKQSWLFSKHLL